MKKLFFVGVFTLTSLAACQNETTTPEVEKQINTDVALAMVKSAANGESSKPNPNGASISCHDNYSNPSGNACVWVNGQQFNVTWHEGFEMNNDTGIPYPTTIWNSTPASFCNC